MTSRLQAPPKHIIPTILLCLVPYTGLSFFLIISHRSEALIHQPDASWLVPIVLLGALAPMARLVVLTMLLFKEKERFRLDLLIQTYISLVIVFASIFALLQVGQTNPAFSGMLTMWDENNAMTLGDHITQLNRIFGESVYLSVVTITTVGFGDIVPLSAYARLIVMMEALIGVAFGGIVLGQYFSFCSRRNSPSQVKE